MKHLGSPKNCIIGSPKLFVLALTVAYGHGGISTLLKGNERSLPLVLVTFALQLHHPAPNV